MVLLRGIGGCKKYPRGVKGGESRYLDLEREKRKRETGREGEWWVEREGKRIWEGKGETGSLDIPIYIIHILFLVSKM